MPSEECDNRGGACVPCRHMGPGSCDKEQEHTCLDGVRSTEPSWWANDAQGILLCRVCPKCEKRHLSRYRPEILTGYDQSDVDEPIEPDGDW